MKRAVISMAALAAVAWSGACVRGGSPGDSPEADAAPPGPDRGDEAPAPPEPDAGEEGPAPTPPPGTTCEPGARPGPAGRSDNLKTPGGLGFVVRTPDGYSATLARPLVVVYAPAGTDARGTESFTGLTAPALARGYLVAYADHLTPGTLAARKLAFEVVTESAARWCVDPDRIYMTGHSDGASTVVATVFQIAGPPLVAAIAPSATGVSLDSSTPCPAQKPLSAMVLHSRDDALFPGLGKRVRDYMLRCGGCDKAALETLPDGCVPYGGCDDGQAVQYCEGAGAHGVWPRAKNEAILGFFDAHQRGRS